MTWQSYTQKFKNILEAENPEFPYDDPYMLNYTRLNDARQNRWLKIASLNVQLVKFLQNLTRPQRWEVITEPWCGDASHILPILHLLAQKMEKVTLSIQLRDADSEIEKYLTDGKKAIPILIVRDEDGNDLFHWGPRPQPTQTLYNELKQAETSLDDLKIAVQKWYNEDKAVILQEELLAKFRLLSPAI